MNKRYYIVPTILLVWNACTMTTNTTHTNMPKTNLYPLNIQDHITHTTQAPHTTIHTLPTTYNTLCTPIPPPST